MKVKNIVFSGFAAAILMGTAGANAATPFKIASQAYVDRQIENLTGADGAVSQLEEKVAGENETLSNAFESGTTLTGAVNDLKGDVDTLMGDENTPGSVAEAKAAADDAQADVDALGEAIGDGFSEQNTVADAIASKADAAALGAGIGTGAGEKTVAAALEEKVNVADKATTIGTVATASDDKWATEKAVATVVQGITGGSGTVSQQIEAVVGNLGTNATSGNENTVEEALALKANAADVATDAEVAGLLGDGITPSSTVTQQLANKQNALSADQLNSITAAATLLAAGYQTCINQSGGSGHCVLTAASNGLTWTDVTSPFEITE